MSDHERIFLLETLSLAGAEVLRHFRRRVDARAKADRSLVTDADLASERLIIDRVKSRFPDDAVFAEESGVTAMTRRPNQRVWVIDPLDGTTNFAHGYPFFCVSIARGHFDANGRVVVDIGGIIDPVRQRFWWAIRGQGAFVQGPTDPTPIRMAISDQGTLSDAFLVTGFYYFRDEALARELGHFQTISSQAHAVRRDGSAALDLALVAEGIYDGFWERGLKLWDVAAGSLLIEESLGVIKNYGAGDAKFDIEGDGLIAGPPGIVRDLSQIIS